MNTPVLRSNGRVPLRTSLGFVCALATSLSLTAQTTTRVSVDSAGTQLNDASIWGTISANGRHVAFVSADSTLVPGDTNGQPDVFVRDLQTGIVVRANVTLAGIQADDTSHDPKLSADGRFVAFSTFATNLAPSDNNGSQTDIYVKDLQTGALEHVSVSSAGVGGDRVSAYLDLSEDGRYVTFYSYSTNLVAGDTNGTADTFLHDRQLGTTERVSVDSNGAQLSTGGLKSAVSGDGRYIAFETAAQSLGLQGGMAIALRDRQTGTTTALNVQGGLVWQSEDPEISADGSLVTFTTRFRLNPLDLGNEPDVYAVDIATGAIEFISRPTTVAPPRSRITAPGGISADGRFVIFVSDGVYDAADTNEARDIFVHDRTNGTTERVSVGFASLANDSVFTTSGISADGRRVAITSAASNLVVNDTNGVTDVFVRERCATATTAAYGTGLAGTGGVVPALALAGPPTIGTTPLLALSNSASAFAPAALVIGSQAVSITTPFIGTLLVAPIDVAAFALAPTGLVLSTPIPNDIDLCGLELRMQLLVTDPGAPAGIAFSRGLELVIGV